MQERDTVKIMSFKDYYYNELRDKLKSDLGIKNQLAVPKVIKIVINVGSGEAATNKKVLDEIVEELKLITGQKPVITKARQSISAFKIRKGMPIGVKVTLRGKKMYDFFEKLVKIVLPRFRDFSGIDVKAIDRNGNLNLGVSEQTLFPEIEYDKISKVRGLQITLVTNAGEQERGKKLLQSFGIPFKN